MMEHGSACGPVIVPVFKTGERRAIPSLVGSTPTRFRHLKPASLLKIFTLVPGLIAPGDVTARSERLLRLIETYVAAMSKTSKLDRALRRAIRHADGK